MTETTRRLRAMILDKHSGHGRPFPLDRRQLAEHRPDIGGENAIRHSIDVLIQAGEIRALPRRHIRASTMYEILGETLTHPQPTPKPPIKKDPHPGYCPEDNIRGGGLSGRSDELGDGIPEEDTWMYGDADWQMDRPKPKRHKRAVKIDWSRVEIDRAVVARYSPKIEFTLKLGTQADREAITRRIRAELSPIEHSDPVAVSAQADDRLVKLRADNRPLKLSRELFDKLFAGNDKLIPAHIIPPAPAPILGYGYWHFANLDEAVVNHVEIDAHMQLAEAAAVGDVFVPAPLDPTVSPPASAASEASERWEGKYDRSELSEPIEIYLARMEAAETQSANQDTANARGSVMHDGLQKAGIGLKGHVPGSSAAPTIVDVGVSINTGSGGLLDPVHLLLPAIQTSERGSVDLPHPFGSDPCEPIYMESRCRQDHAEHPPLSANQGQRPFACKIRLKVRRAA